MNSLSDWDIPGEIKRLSHVASDVSHLFYDAAADANKARTRGDWRRAEACDSIEENARLAAVNLSLVVQALKQLEAEGEAQS